MHICELASITALTSGHVNLFNYGRNKGFLNLCSAKCCCRWQIVIIIIMQITLIVTAWIHTNENISLVFFKQAFWMLSHEITFLSFVNSISTAAAVSVHVFIHVAKYVGLDIVIKSKQFCIIINSVVLEHKLYHKIILNTARKGISKDSC